MSSDTTNIYLGMTGACAWAYWEPAGWAYAGDSDGNCVTAYYRVFAWR